MAHSTRRRREVPSKGDRREQAILDATEHLLATETLETITVEAIATRAGISRGTLYFYFGSKQEALAALVDRTVRGFNTSARDASLAVDQTADAAIVHALDDAAELWREHGTVMRAAVENSGGIPQIGATWLEALESTVSGTTDVLIRAGFAQGDGPAEAGGLARTLCWMTERVFYRASVDGTDLTAARDSCEAVWLAVIASR